jgi:hypothetical protein
MVIYWNSYNIIFYTMTAPTKTSDNYTTTKKDELTTVVSLKALKAYIKKNYGKRCKDFNISCPVCKMWLAYDILEDDII